MRVISTIVVLMFAASGVGAAVIVNPANGHSYSLTSTAMSWTDAEAEAVGLGGHLATVRSDAENQWIMDTFGGGAVYWIGIHQLPNSLEPDGGFVWSSGEAVTYTNWMSGEPSNGGDNEAFGELIGAWGGKWNDAPNIPGDGAKYGVIEGVPEPTALCVLFVGGMLVMRRSRKESQEA